MHIYAPSLYSVSVLLQTRPEETWHLIENIYIVYAYKTIKLI
jgi:hypothetical protein